MSSKTYSNDHEATTIQPGQGFWLTYDATDGLPGGVLCLLQDQKGYLWLGTQSGLCRYDGQEFVTFTTADGLADDFVMALCEDGEGRLWIGTGWSNITGAGVSCYDGERFVTYTTEDGLAHNHVSDIFCDSQGQLWFATPSGVSRFDGKRFITYAEDDESEEKRVSAICEDHEGRLWFGTQGMLQGVGRGVLRYDGERFVTFNTDSGLLNNHIGVVCCDSKGYLWFGFSVDAPNGGIAVYDGKSFANCASDDWLSGPAVLAIYEATKGRLWIGTFDGGVTCIYDPESFAKSCNGGFSLPTQPDETGKEELVSGRRLRGKRRNQNSQETPQFTTYTTDDGLLSNRIMDIIEDREGSIWFANMLSGLTRFDPGTLQPLTEEPVSEILFQDREGKLWFGNGTALCCLCNGQQRLKTFNAIIECLLEDSSGNFWISTRGDGLYRYDSCDAVWESAGQRFGEAEGLGDRVEALLEGRDGTVWIGTSDPGRLCRFDGEGFSTISTPHEVILRLFQDSCGRIWMGGWAGGGLSCYHGERLKTYTVADGLPGDNILSILEDDAGNLWIGAERWLCRFDGKRFIVYGKEQGLTSRAVHQCSVKDATGQLWFGTMAGGLFRYDGKHFQRLTAADGLPHNSITGLIPQPDGSMLIGTYGGIAHYSPTATLPPGIEIREVMADEIYQNPTELELTTTGADLLTISYHGMSLATRRMRYSYILEGHDESWRDTWENLIRYEGLPIGEYTFKVIAINRDLVCSEEPATLKLSIIPDPRDEQIAQLEGELVEQERARKEAERVQAAKMVSLRQLVAGVAHQMNNPVGTIASNNDISNRAVSRIREIIAEFGSQEIKENSQLTRAFAVLDKMNEVNQDASGGIARTVADLRSFVRLDEAEWQLADIHEAMDTVLDLMKSEFSDRIRAIRDYGDIPRIYCSPSSLNQVFMSMFRNACEAIDGEGEVRLRTSVQEENVTIEINDTGAGISPTDINRVFDPGFTTKGVKVGVGLGLSICYQIVIDEHKGRIDVSSEPGKGATFTITLPKDYQD